MRKRKTLADILDQLTKDLREAAMGELEDALSGLLQNFGVSPAAFAQMLQSRRRWDPYRLLGLEPNASDEEVKKRYLELARRLHPDVGGEATQELFKLVQAAYDEIKRQRGFS